jgi:hypothetical protein
MLPLPLLLAMLLLRLLERRREKVAALIPTETIILMRISERLSLCLLRLRVQPRNLRLVLRLSRRLSGFRLEILIKVLAHLPFALSILVVTKNSVHFIDFRLQVPAVSLSSLLVRLKIDSKHLILF